MMNIILVIGLLTLSQSLHGHNANDLSASSTNPKAALKLFCEIFPNTVQLDCKSDKSLIKTKLQEKDALSLQDANSKHAENPTECLLCKQIMKQLEKILPRKPTKDKIKKALVKVCKAFSGKTKAKCKMFVSINSKKIIKYLLLKYAPKKLCKLLLVCPDTPTNDGEKIFDTVLNWRDTFHDYTGKEEVKDEENVKEKDAANPLVCGACKELITYLMKILRQNKTKEAIEGCLKKVCGVIPRKWKKRCENIVKTNTAKIVDFIINHVNPSMICHIISACSDYEKSANDFQAVLRTANLTDVTDPILNQVKSLCSILPFPLKDNCIQAISRMSREDINNVLKIENLKTLYEIIEGHNKENLNSFEKNSFSKEHPEVYDDCILCRLIMKELEKILPRKPTQDKIKKALVKVCKAFSGKTKANCKKFVSINSKKIIKYLLLKYAPKKLCKLLLVCPDTPTNDDEKIVDGVLNRSDKFDDYTGKEEVKDEENVKAKDPEICETYKKLVVLLKKIIQDDESEDLIKNAWKIICSHSTICHLLRLCSTQDDLLYLSSKGHSL